MKVVIQIVSCAAVHVSGNPVARIGKGLLILIGAEKGDTEKDAAYLADKILKLRIFEDDAGKMNRSVKDIGGEILLVSQFTLFADCGKGTRPGFDKAESPENARTLIDFFEREIERLYRKPEKGIFGERMDVEIHNRGPVTIILDSKKT